MANNDNSESAAMGLFFAGLVVAGLFLFALAAFFALLLTIVSCFAWNNPVRLLGTTVYPHEARAFVRNGVIGTFLAPAFVVFMQVLFGFQIESQYWPYVFILGYTFGSLVISTVQFREEEAARRMRDVSDPSPVAHLPPPVQSPPAEAFRFADWNDEDAR